MKNSLLHSIISDLYNAIEQINNDKSQTSKHLFAAINDMKPTESLTKSPTETDGLDNTTELVDTVMEQAYKILCNESKPGPTLLKKEMGIPLTQAKKYFKQLVDEGLINVPVTKKPIVKKERNVMELINDLPEGNDLLVSEHLHSLMALSEDRRAKYLTGLELGNLITPDRLASAAKTGVNLALVNQIDVLAKKKPLIVKEAIETLNDKYLAHITKWCSIVHQGDALFKHMTRNGVNLSIMRDFKDIAIATKKGEV